jgi:hypothetical protein
VRVPGQNDGPISVAAPNEGRLQASDCGIESVDCIATPQPQIRRNLVVAAAGRVKLSPRVANTLDQGAFNVQVNVFQFGAELEAALLNLLANRFQALLNLSAIVDCYKANTG